MLALPAFWRQRLAPDASRTKSSLIVTANLMTHSLTHTWHYGQQVSELHLQGQPPTDRQPGTDLALMSPRMICSPPSLTVASRHVTISWLAARPADTGCRRNAAMREEQTRCMCEGELRRARACILWSAKNCITGRLQRILMSVFRGRRRGASSERYGYSCVAAAGLPCSYCHPAFVCSWISLLTVIHIFWFCCILYICCK